MPNDDGHGAGTGGRGDVACRSVPARSASAVVGQVLRQQLDVPAVEAVLAAIRGNDRPVGISVIGVVCS